MYPPWLSRSLEFAGALLGLPVPRIALCRGWHSSERSGHFATCGGGATEDEWQAPCRRRITRAPAIHIQQGYGDISHDAMRERVMLNAVAARKRALLLIDR